MTKKVCEDMMLRLLCTAFLLFSTTKFEIVVVSRQIALDQLVRGTAQPIMSRAQLQRVPCYGQIAEPVTATGEVIESPEDFDTMLQGNKFGKKDMLQKMCEMHHIATRQGTVKYSTFVTNGNNGIGRHFTRL